MGARRGTRRSEMHQPLPRVSSGCLQVAVPSGALFKPAPWAGSFTNMAV